MHNLYKFIKNSSFPQDLNVDDGDRNPVRNNVLLTLTEISEAWLEEMDNKKYKHKPSPIRTFFHHQ